MLYGPHIKQQLLLEEFVFPLIIKLWLVEGCYFATLILFLGTVAPSTDRKKKTCLPNFFSWVSLFLSLIHPPTPPSFADSSPLLLLCCWRQLIVSAFILLNWGFPRSRAQVGAPSRFLNPYHNANFFSGSWVNHSNEKTECACWHI